MNQQCKVCGEPAAGFHFGAFTCEGCKVSGVQSVLILNGSGATVATENGRQCPVPVSAPVPAPSRTVRPRTRRPYGRNARGCPARPTVYREQVLSSSRRCCFTYVTATGIDFQYTNILILLDAARRTRLGGLLRNHCNTHKIRKYAYTHTRI